MIDFVLDFLLESERPLSVTYHDSEKVSIIEKYANFLKQPLELGMFVPCDEQNNVLKFEEYQGYVILFQDHNDLENKKSKINKGGEHAIGFYRYENSKFQQAQERVLFDGFEFKTAEKENYSWVNCKGTNIPLETLFKETIEGLVRKTNPFVLTESALKQIGL